MGGKNVGSSFDIDELFIAEGAVENKQRFENIDKTLNRISPDEWIDKDSN